MTIPHLDTMYRIAGIAGLVGTVLIGGWRAAESRYVHTATYDSTRAVDVLEHQHDDAEREYIRVQIDSANLRLRQLTCGTRVETGCR